MLGTLEQLLVESLNTTNAHYESFSSAVQNYLDVIHTNQLQMHPEKTYSPEDYANMPVTPSAPGSSGDDSSEGSGQ